MWFPPPRPKIHTNENEATRPPLPEAAAPAISAAGGARAVATSPLFPRDPRSPSNAPSPSTRPSSPDTPSSSGCSRTEHGLSGGGSGRRRGAGRRASEEGKEGKREGQRRAGGRSSGRRAAAKLRCGRPACKHLEQQRPRPPRPGAVSKPAETFPPLPWPKCANSPSGSASPARRPSSDRACRRPCGAP